ncbi:4Fe-4S binding protein [bacterium]|nr:4Fe-4S binding protein [bacterium]
MKNKISQLNSKGLAASLIVTLLFAGFVIFPPLASGKFAETRSAVLYTITLAFPVLMMFLVLHTGRVHRWRRIFFVTYAVAFVISFVWLLMGDRGHMWLLDREFLYAKAPMCHFVVPVLLLPLIFKKEFIFPNPYLTQVGMIVMVLIVAVVYGRAFCSWACFFGGQDELFSSIRKKKTLKFKKLPLYIRYFAFGMLAFIVLHSLATLSPTYCVWFCPFKSTSEFIEINSFIRVIQTFIFVGLWLGLVVILPLLSKKRTQCSIFCPMGAFFSLTGKINLFKIKIDRDKCTGCERCISVCPTFSMTKDSMAEGKAMFTCVRCGACMEACPEGAIDLGIIGVPFTSGNHPLIGTEKKIGFWRKLVADIWDPKVVFIFGIFGIGAVLATTYLVDSLSRILEFFFGV